jgi:hypothetical protein
MTKEFVFTLPENNPTLQFYSRVSPGNILMNIKEKGGGDVSLSLDESSYWHLRNNLGSEVFAAAFGA